MSIVQCTLGFLGRALLSLIFIFAAIGKLFDWQGAEQYVTTVLSDLLMRVQGVAWQHDVIEHMLVWAPMLLLLAFLLELIGGILLFFGFKVRLGALLLIFFLIPTTLIFHSFWMLQGAERSLQMTMFMKNLSILGGLFLVLAVGKPCGKKSCSAPHPKLEK